MRRSGMGLAALLGGLAATVLAPAAPAATLARFYYAGAPGMISNTPADDRALVNTGVLTIDRSGAPGGSLAGLELSSRLADDRADAVGVDVDFRFGTWGGEGIGYRLRFDAAERLVEWSFFADFQFERYLERWWEVSSVTGDRFNFVDIRGHWFGAHENATRVIGELGYTGAAAQALYCGSWAGQSCAETSGQPGEAWGIEFLAGPGGAWFSDPLAFAAGVERNTRLAVADPPLSFYDIKPVPLPAAGLMLLGGLGLLAAVRRRAIAAQSGERVAARGSGAA